MSKDTDTILGIVLLARHGDRTTFFQDPRTYDASQTTITPLGEQQEFELGSLIRSQYLDPNSPTYIQDINPSMSLFNPKQVVVRADAGDEGGVIFSSSIALLQGLFPATSLSNITLANGTTVFSPLGGYQYVPVETVEADQDISLQGFTSCNALNGHTARFYGSSQFRRKARESAEFLSKLPPFLDGRSATLENMWNVFDFINVQSIHNATYAQRLPPTFLEQARDLANFHEHGVFTDTELGGIGNIAARTVLPSIFRAFERIAKPYDPLKLHYSAISYKPFLSLFDMIGVNIYGEIPPAIVNYAAAVVLEIRQPSFNHYNIDTNSDALPIPLEPVIRFKFKNGSDDSGFTSYPMTFKGWDGRHHKGEDVPLSTFIKAFEGVVVNNKFEWCRVCGQRSERGCKDFFCPGFPVSTDITDSKQMPPLNWGIVGQVEEVGGRGLNVILVAVVFGLFALLLVKWSKKSGWRQNGAEIHMMSEDPRTTYKN